MSDFSKISSYEKERKLEEERKRRKSEIEEYKRENHIIMCIMLFFLLSVMILVW